ncbi:MAG TPA: TFIIB-type zinc finger domain-containing protein [Dissulfurispiraceae bacterium]|nr:TFIIB-type zinc finger domain-containing protein [Dissulfurispiraceae bacterium]
MVLPNLGLMSMGITALFVGLFLTVKDHEEKSKFRCKKCGETDMHTNAGRIYCKNGHRVIVDK